MDANRSRNFDLLKKRLAEIDICVSHSDAGYYTVSTTVEPLFCFQRNSVEEAIDLAKLTLVSYISTFYEVEDFHVSVVSEPVHVPVVPVERTSPFSRLIPSFDNDGNDRFSLAMA
jgi:hypothetical protein